MNKFVMVRFVTAVDYWLIQFSIRLPVATALTTQLNSSPWRGISDSTP